jgi:transcription initiation factor TFIID TATA-box-binding protein
MGTNVIDSSKDYTVTINTKEIITGDRSLMINTFSYKLINLVSLGLLKDEEDQLIQVNFESIEKKIKCKRLNRFPCVMFKVKGSKDNLISCILFRNGKMIVTGIKDETKLAQLQIEIESQLIKAEIKFADFSMQVQNLVVMSQLGKKINLELACLMLTNCLYEPEQFPAAIIKPPLGGTFLLFSNSKIICLGMRDFEQMEISLTNLIQDLFDYELFFEDFD